MGGRLRLASATGVLLACCVVACGGGDSPTASGVKEGRGRGHPDSPGGMHGGGPGGAPGCGAMGGAGGIASPSSLPPPAGSFAAGSLCEADGWCWYNPRPSGATWQGVAGAGRTDLWIGGDTRNLLHFDGGRWTAVTSPMAITSGIWGASENDVWFGGQSSIEESATAVIAHWDGAAVTAVGEFGAGAILDVWGSGASDVYAVGFNTAQHWNGSAWTTVPGVNGLSVSGSGPNDVWIGASDGMWHFDGTSWSRVAELAGAFVLGVSAVGPGDAWTMVLRAGTVTVQHFDGTSWSVSLQIPDIIAVNLNSIHASSSQSVWVVGNEFVNGEQRGYLNHFDGSAWTRAPIGPTSLRRVTGAAGIGDIAVGQNGGILRLTAAPAPAFTDLRTGPGEHLFGTWGSAPADMWAVGNAGTVLHHDGQAVASVPAGTSVNLADVWGTGPADVWAVGQGGTVLHYDGNAFAPVASGTGAALHAVFTAAPNDVWIGGQGTLLHWDGTSMSPVAVPGLPADMPIRDLHGLAADDIWLSGGGVNAAGTSTTGFVSHYDGTAWSPVQVLTSEIGSSDAVLRIWALSPADVWALTDRSLSGGRTIYHHFDGTAWTSVLAVSPPTFVFPGGSSGGSFVFGEHDRWRATFSGTWQRNTQ